MSTAQAEKKLTLKQEQFCLEYIIDFNGAQAAFRAGYSKHSARITASKLLTNPNIQARITQLTLERQKRARKNGDDVIRELENIGFGRLGKVISWNESGMAFLKNSDDLDDDSMAMLESVEVTENVTHVSSSSAEGEKGATQSSALLKTKVKLKPALPALNLLAKHHNLLNETKMDLNITGAIEVISQNYAGSTGGEKPPEKGSK